MAHNSSRDKWVAAVIAALIAFLVFSPFALNLTNSLINPALGIDIARQDGHCPSLAGLAVHAALYLVILRLLM